MYEDFIESIENADRVLVGVGPEAGVKYEYDSDVVMMPKDAYPYLAKVEKEKDSLLDFYNKLARILRDKDYFVITTNYDGIISESKLNKIKIVAPCGNIHKLQCDCEKITDMPGNFFVNDDNGICPECKTRYQINVYNRQKYNENGYLKQWNMYNMWLQGTMGKKLLILELGCDFSFLSIIRIPFERIAMINQKAEYYRVSEKYPQITAQLNDKMHSINVSPVDFISKLTV